MEHWQTVLQLKIRGIPWKLKIGFDYEWKAWLLAYDLMQVGPEEFNKLDFDRQLTALAYGAAAWHLLKNGRRVYFTYEDIAEALLKATKAENKQLEQAMAYAKFPDWLKAGVDKSKKKEET